MTTRLSSSSGDDPSRYAPLMRRALELAARGQGAVEPNPMVGCVLAHPDPDADDDDASGAAWRTVGEGWHERFGGPHAEANALAAAGERARGATAFVTLEPCCHTGKTPPCVEALIAAGVARVVVARLDPFPEVAGGGVAALEAAGIPCVVGPGRDEAERLLAPYLTLLQRERPWVIAKWAMTLDGKIATRGGDSQWISGEASRDRVHALRGRVDAVIVGAGTLVADDPLLTARPTDERLRKRVPRRIVVAGDRPLPRERKLWEGGESVTVAVGDAYPDAEADALAQRGVEVLRADVDALLRVLGQRRLTNALVEGGAKLVGRMLDARLVDEVHAYVAPKLVGGQGAPGPLAGVGVGAMSEAIALVNPTVERVGDDTLITGRVRR